MNRHDEIYEIKERIKEYLPTYLGEHGIQASGHKSFKCINPEHNDNHPSCSLIPNSDGRLLHCFSCNLIGDIFVAASLLEDKPLSGPGFINDNLRYLAKKYNIEVPELTADESYELDVFRAYADAAMIVKRPAHMSDKVKSWLTDRGWLDNENSALTRIGVGSIDSFEDYLHRMTTHYKHKISFLEEVDLTRKSIFNPDTIIFTVKDEHGSPVGFAGRNLRYEEQKAAYETAVKDILITEGEKSPKLADLFKPSKYYNTSEKCPIYHKSKRLFNFNLAKKSTPPLYVFEGYSDVVTANIAGLRNCVSIGSTSFSQEHLDLILNTDPPTKHIIFVLDADKAGNEGTKRFVELLESCVGGHIGLRTEIITMPEGSDDPDAFIRKYSSFEQGAQAFRQLEKIDIFTWKLQQGKTSGQDALTLSQDAIPLIVNEPNFLIRMDMTEKLSKITGQDKEGVWREVMRMIDSEASRVEEEKALIAKRTIKELGRNTRNTQATLQHALQQIENVEKRRAGYDGSAMVRAVEWVLERAADQKVQVELNTGFEKLNKAIGGLPREECFISLPGPPNQGKSTTLDNITKGLLDNNLDCMVLFHTIDDSLSIRVSRILGARSNYPSKYFQKSGYYLSNPQVLPPRYRHFDEEYQIQNRWISNMIHSERLILYDINGLPPNLPSLETYIRGIRTKYPNRTLVIMGDNFHLYDLPGYEAGEHKTREMSMFVKRMTTEYHCTILMTAELPKSALRPGERPRLANIKGTSGISYDASANFGVYNDMKSRDKKSVLFWEDHAASQDHIGLDSGGAEIGNPKKPIIEIVIDKSKISDYDGSIFFRLDPVTGRMEECDEAEQTEMWSKSYGDPHKVEK